MPFLKDNQGVWHIPVAEDVRFLKEQDARDSSIAPEEMEIEQRNRPYPKEYVRTLCSQRLPLGGSGKYSSNNHTYTLGGVADLNPHEQKRICADCTAKQSVAL